MANIKISELNPLLTVEDADVLPIVDNAITKKVTAAILRSYTQGNSVLLTGNQTVAGIKTFTSQLASSVATGTAPFSVASTTKVTNLNADLLDGLSSADFATLTGTQTLTNKTITSPVINEILDSNGNEILGFTPIASATDYITIKNGIGVGVPLHISAAGSSTNTGIHLEPKGTGLVQISDGTDTTKGIRFRSSASATGAITLIDAVSSAGRVITLPNATGTVALTSDLTSYVPTTRTVSTTSPLSGGGALSGDLTLSIPQASGSVNGYLASTDFATFNAKQNAITLTTTGTSGAATLVGSTLNIPNYADTDTGITSLNGLTALTQTFAVGTSGTDFGISSATSTHTFNLPTASAANRGALSSADWTTFNNKQNALTNPITGTGTTNYLPKFTGASTLGNSIVREGTGGISINGTLPNTDTTIHSTKTTTNYLDLQSTVINQTVGLITRSASKSYFTGLNYSAVNIWEVYDLTANASRFTISTTGAATFTGKLTVDNNSGLSILASTSFGMNMYFDGATGYSYIDSKYDSAGSGRLYIRTRTNGTPVNALMFLGTGEATFSSGIGIGTATAGTSGIQFPATQVASANNNNLDDYEEGTWTMGVTFGGAAVGVTYSANTGNYVKIGKQVTVTGYMLLTNKGTSTGTVSLTGLPFTVAAAAANYSATPLVLSNITFLATNGGYSNVGTSTVSLTQTTTAGVTSALADTNFANNSSVIISLTYFV